MPSREEIIEEAGAWLEENLDPNLSLVEWRSRLVDGGWGSPRWPKEYWGRGYTTEETNVVTSLFIRKGAVPAASAGSRNLAAETILACGTDDQKKRFLRGILTGEDFWCQLFSEPGSGSDLAGLTTKAEFKDGKWVINGQKVWNTSAHHADWGILVARTNWDVPKHQGISYFLINMHQPGVEVRPLRQMNDHASFNEVFLTDAIVEPENLVGAEGEGWAVAKTTLSYERGGFGTVSDIECEVEKKGRLYDEYDEEMREANEPYVWYPQRQGRVDLAVPRAQATGTIKDGAVRQEVARLISMKRGAELAARAAKAKVRSGSNEIVSAGSIGKLASSFVARQGAKVHTMISGADSLLKGEDSAEQGVIAEILVSVPAISIAGGTDEIQKNIISERVLGMPKEMRADTGPFRDIKRN